MNCCRLYGFLDLLTKYVMDSVNVITWLFEHQWAHWGRIHRHVEVSKLKISRLDKGTMYLPKYFWAQEVPVGPSMLARILGTATQLTATTSESSMHCWHKLPFSDSYGRHMTLKCPP